MPLVHGKSQKSFEKNVKTEMEAHPGKENRASNLAIAYAIKRKAQHKAHGGDAAMEEAGEHMCKGGACEHPSHYAEGGAVGDEKHRKDFEQGINRQSVAYPESKGMSNIGAMVRKGDTQTAKNIVKTKMEYGHHPKPDLMAHGGEMSKRERAMAAFHGKKMASGGLIDDAVKVAPLLFAASEGGFIGSRQSLEKPEVDGDLMPEAHKHLELEDEHVSHPSSHDSHADHAEFNQEGAEDEGAGDMDSIHPMIQKIMMGRVKGYSRGGVVANEDQGESASEPDEMAKWKENEFDDLALRNDDMESADYTGANSGDEDGDTAEDHNREDIISRIMKSRAKRDRMAVPGEGSSYGKGK